MSYFAEPVEVLPEPGGQSGIDLDWLPSGKRTLPWKITSFIGESTNSMAIFNSELRFFTRGIIPEILDLWWIFLGTCFFSTTPKQEISTAVVPYYIILNDFIYIEPHYFLFHITGSQLIESFCPLLWSGWTWAKRWHMMTSIRQETLSKSMPRTHLGCVDFGPKYVQTYIDDMSFTYIYIHALCYVMLCFVLL